MDLEPHVRLRLDAREILLAEAARGSYEKASCIIRRTVIKHVRMLSFPVREDEMPKKKHWEKYLYVEADENHIVLQFYERKEDIKNGRNMGQQKGHKAGVCP